jgi:peptidoglycan/xylan/chitin deacetylase (PgdA/CDA1 family)
MSLSELDRRPSAGPATGLVATRRLGVLEELRVPYFHEESSVSPDGWASLRALDPARALHWFVGNRGELADGWSLGSIRISGRVAPDSSVASLAGSTPGEWAREAPIIDRRGAVRSWTWRASDGATILPFDPDETIANLRSERYLRLDESRAQSLIGSARRTYYAIRPLLPRGMQLALRRAFSRIQARTAFPRWPVEPALHDLVDLVLQSAADAAGEPVPCIASWPRGRSWALVLTHDVETSSGRDSIERLRSVEAALGFRSAWNLVPERYEVPDSLVTRLKAAGCEVGVHGLRHDGRDLDAWDGASSRVPEMQRWARRWGSTGFRCPATHRIWEAMPELGFAYDSSYPDTDPFEPMAGGCCSWLPFFNQDMVELPITLTQDHTLFVILRRDESLWREKLEILRARGGMALAIVHPDYMVEDGRLDAYRRLLESVCDDPEVWTPLPYEVADWWRRRSATSLELVAGDWQPRGPAATEVAITYARPRFLTHTPERPGNHGCV